MFYEVYDTESPAGEVIHTSLIQVGLSGKHISEIYIPS